MVQVPVLRLAVAAVVLALPTACSSGSGGATAEGARSQEPSTSATGPTAASPSATPGESATPAYDPGPWRPLRGLGRCGPQPPRLAHERFTTAVVRGPGLVLPAVTAGRGRTVAVLLHQTNGNGFCGWLSFAQRVAQVPGQTALAIDLCGYGQSDCAEGSTTIGRQVAQVRAAIGYARDRLGARRIVLVGASMGGSLAVLAAARDRRVDAVVDLSGPEEWGGAAVHRHGAELRAPLLVAMSDRERPVEIESARALADAAPPGSVFLGADSGHGYELLEAADGRPTPVSDQVLARIAGR
jgi:dienelactone hydrolase